jgi:hypothetical protein
MPPAERSVIAFFTTRGEVASALTGLRETGIDRGAVRVLPERFDRPDGLGVQPIGSAPEGAALGALVGGLAGALAGVLAAGGSLVIPRLGAVLAGPLVAALTGAGAMGALGMLAGALAGARRPRFLVAYLGNAAHTSGALVAVRCAADQVSRVERALAEAGAAALHRRP